jgi:hypothetical protein
MRTIKLEEHGDINLVEGIVASMTTTIQILQWPCGTHIYFALSME